MTVPEHTPRALGVDAETVSRWRNRGLLRARVLHSDQLRLGREDDAPAVGAADAPTLTWRDDMVAVRVRLVG